MKNRWIYLLVLIIAVSTATGCKKNIREAQENILVQAMITGQWKITNFTRNSVDITADFSNYKFQYYANRTVDAINNGSVEKTGNWDGDVAARTTWASFTNASHPITLLNGTWSITDNSWTYVVATQTSGGETKTMRLEKL